MRRQTNRGTERMRRHTKREERRYRDDNQREVAIEAELIVK
jgi:hypothetical protein